MSIRFFIATAILVMSYACGQQATKKEPETNTPKAGTTATNNSSPDPYFKLANPAVGSTFKAGAAVDFAYSATSDKSPDVDHAVLLINGVEINKFKGKEFSWKAAATQYGNATVTVSLRNQDGAEIEKLNSLIKIYPEAPKFYDYKVVKSYPHRVTAYTQGLFIADNVLYESTGQYGQSSLSKIDLETGKVLKEVKLDDKYFGEGSTILDGKIYMLTWETRKGFIYDSNTLDLLGEFEYPTEGWGLTTDGKFLIMSDGSSIIRFLDPKTFKEVRNIEVCSDKGSVDSLNELEYINDEIWANIYQQDAVVCINPKTGAITKVIDFRNLLPMAQKTSTTDVLNGIAYNENTKQVFVTGKNWPFLYEVKVEPRVYDKKK